MRRVLALTAIFFTAVAPGAAQVPFIRGDVDASGDLTITDPIRSLGYLFLGQATPDCLDAADSNGDLKLDLSDPIHTLAFLFTGGPAPPVPFPGCGPGAPEGPGCSVFAACADPGCPDPLDEETLESLVLVPYEKSAQAGETVQLVLGVWVCCTFVEPVPACVQWSVEPAGLALVFPETGTIRVDPAASHGDVITLTADVESGRRILTTQVHIYTKDMSPLVGEWLEVAQVLCKGGEEAAPDVPIQELLFDADGTFSVTWRPFEAYVDYWGTYTFDLATGSILLEVTGGNYVPPDLLQMSPTFRADDTHLSLDGIWLGTPNSDPPPATQRCGHRFKAW